MISFYPGPSKVYPQIPTYVQEAYTAGVLSINHRSPEFMTIFERTVALVKEKLRVPEAYTVLFASSATECWEIIGQSVIKNQSFHIYNGAFGEKWHRYTDQLVSSTSAFVFDPQTLPDASAISMPPIADVVCLTHNETSNGTALPAQWLHQFRESFAEALIAIDATSSMAGVELPWPAGDVWYASVQKCFGLPAGLSVLVLSPKAIDRVKQLGEKQHYNSLLSIYEQSQRHQTTHTPNVLGTYLLMRTLEQRPHISVVDEEVTRRYHHWVQVLGDLDYLDLLIDHDTVRSKTVIPFAAKPEVINQLRDEVKKAGITLGNGYGAWKSSTLRIANFPAITSEEIDQLITFLQQFSPTSV
ncbi:MAG: aminotransferase class V-fold PLP-dependent enzyme [Cyclobacteriaceae bacterium]